MTEIDDAVMESWDKHLPTAVGESMLNGHRLEMAAQHASRIAELVSSKTPTVRGGEDTGFYPVKSWRRCIEDYRLDPAAAIDIAPYVGVDKLNIARDSMGEDLSIASDELADLFAAVHGIGYSAGLTNHDGLFVLEKADRESANYVSTDQPGWLWSEKIGGTNSVGTCVVEQKVTSVFGRQHFFSQSTDTACAGAPVFDASGTLWGVLSITTRNVQLELQTHILATHVVAQSAIRLSARMFRRTFAGLTIIEWRTPDGASCLIAVNADQRIEGANRFARNALGVSEGMEYSKSLWSVFERNANLRRTKIEGGALELRGLKDRRILHASVTPAAGAATKIILGSKPARTPVSPPSSDLISLDDCAGSDPAMLQNVNILRKVRNAGLPTLLLGETGTGKDTLARAIHADSDRAIKPFVAFNCAAVPESLIDSELFGYTAGTFTGASPGGNRGRILEANGGTLFLDEIGDMPLILQTRLLRVLESREVVALGSGMAQKIDVMVIAATNQNLQARVSQGLFREDLYYRLAGAVIDIPALRERTDLRTIIDRILVRASDGDHRLQPAALNALMEHSWPGNIRELTHVLRRGASLASDKLIALDDLMIQTAIQSGSKNQKSTARTADTVTGYEAVSQAEAETVRLVLDRARGDVAAAAILFGVSRATFYRKMQRHQIGRR